MSGSRLWRAPQGGGTTGRSGPLALWSKVACWAGDVAARVGLQTLELNDMCVELLCNTAGHDGEDVIADLEDGGGLDALKSC